MTGLRIDKWLWAARFFKTRALATAACDAGKVQCNGQDAKPSRQLKVGDALVVRSEGGEFRVEVLALSEQRGSATVAQELYREGEESRAARAAAQAERRAILAAEPRPMKRPSKRDRRLIHSFRGDY